MCDVFRLSDLQLIGNKMADSGGRLPEDQEGNTTTYRSDSPGGMQTLSRKFWTVLCSGYL
jgi:hypothetical protein